MTSWRTLAVCAVISCVIMACDERRAPRMREPQAPVPTSQRPDAAKNARVLELGRDQALVLLCRTLADRDRDCDRRITIEDERSGCSSASNCPKDDARWPYVAEARDVSVRVDDLREAAQLVQELAVAVRKPDATLRLDLARVSDDPVDYLRHNIDHRFWDALTRRIDAAPEHLLRAAADEKLGVGAGAPVDLCRHELHRCQREHRSPAPERAPPTSRELFVYYPASDLRAHEVFGAAGIPGKLSVLPLPARPTTEWVLATTRAGRHGLLTLALDANGAGRPFVVPGGRFNEMYGWDSFFIVAGLVRDPSRIELARSMVDNHAYEIERYGKILNANRTYYLTRSQPPFFTSSIREVWSRLPPTEENRRWLGTVLSSAIKEYATVWSSAPRRLDVCDGGACLSRYFGEGLGEPPEVEPGHFDWFFQTHALSHGHCPRPTEDALGRERFLECVSRLAGGHRAGRLRDSAIDRFFVNDRCIRESGHDTTYRWFVAGEERCADYATVDLNALLFKYETDIAALIEQAFGGTFDGHSAKAFCDKALGRARLVRRYLWDEVSGLFFDYDVKRRRRSDYVAATTLYPLWASAPNGCGASLLTPEMASALRVSALRQLEAPGGLYATSRASLERVRAPSVLERDGSDGFHTKRSGRQWEWPNGWAPHQMLAWTGLRKHGFAEDAERLAYRWLFTIARNAASFHGTVPEKLDIEKRSHAVFAEYGNVNTEFSYITEEGFGWMNASFVVGWDELGAKRRESLRKLVPPESLFATIGPGQ